MGSLLLPIGHALLGQHFTQSGMLVVHLALPSMSAFDWDDMAKVSTLTAGPDPRSTGRPPYLYQWAPPAHEELARSPCLATGLRSKRPGSEGRVAVTLILCGGPGRLRDVSSAIEADPWMQVDGLIH